MIKKAFALLLAVMMLASCQNPSVNEVNNAEAASSKETTVIEVDPSPDGYEPTEITEVVKDGVFQFKPVKGATFTMDYEPRNGSYVANHFGLNFVSPCDTNWLGDKGLQAIFDLNEKTDDVYGSVVITTAPRDFKEYYDTKDKKVIAEKTAEEFLTAENYYNQKRSFLVDEKGFEMIREGYGYAFPNQDIWKAFYVEYIDTTANNHHMILYLCNDEINEKFYSMEIFTAIPADQTEQIDKFRS